jgi:hypothetical protein
MFSPAGFRRETIKIRFINQSISHDVTPFFTMLFCPYLPSPLARISQKDRREKSIRHVPATPKICRRGRKTEMIKIARENIKLIVRKQLKQQVPN